MISDPLKILVVAESLDVNSGSGAKANMALIKNLIKAGFNLKVFHYTRQNISLPASNTHSIQEKRRSVLFILSRVERYIRNLLNISLNPKIEKVTGFSFTLFNDRNSIVSALKKNKDFKPDWILTLSQGGSFRPHHALLKIPEWHHKWIAYIHDPYPMHWYPKPYTWQESGFKKKEEFMKSIAKKSAYTAFPSKMLMDWMGRHFIDFKRKGILIPHQVDHDITLREPDYLRFEEHEFILLHTGNLLEARKPHSLIEGFKKFSKKYPEASARLVHVGPTVHYTEYLASESELNKNIRAICDNKNFQEVAYLQNNATINIILEAKGEFSPFLPGKFPHCVQADKPILLVGPEMSEVRRLLGEKYPHWAPRDQPEKIAIAIEKIYLDWKSGNINLNRKDLEEYLSEEYLKNIFTGL